MSGPALKSIRSQIIHSQIIRSKRGQVSILVGTMMLTFILFFAFAVNVGMLVNAKINLQNAADMAAYAGASVQARQLNHISYLNYEMRRSYKKFLFRYYVMGNMAQHSHPKTQNEAIHHKARFWSPNGRATDTPPIAGKRGLDGEPLADFQVPVNCINVSAQDNPCQVSRIAKIDVPKADLTNAINSVLEKQLNAIEELREGGCRSIGRTNTQLMMYWLYNTDPGLKVIEDEMAGASGDTLMRLKAIRGLAAGLGLVPRQLLLHNRIKTLERYVNMPAVTGLTREGAGGLIKQGDAAARERTYQAFNSAFNSLGDFTFDDPDTVVMDEVLSGTVDQSDDLRPVNLLKLNPIRVGFDVYVAQMGVGACDDPNSFRDNKDKDCNNCPLAMPVNLNLPVGVWKDPDILTYYAVRLQARAKIMFNPFGSDLLMRAYSAAQPFGSRIGPKLDQTAFTRQGKNDNFCNFIGALGNRCLGRVPNLPILQGEGAQNPGEGWDSNLAIWGFWGRFAPQGQSIANEAVIGPENLSRAYQAAMAPNPWELGQYNIPVSDLPNAPGQLANLPDAFQRNFNPRGQMAFWAPIRSADDNGGQFDRTEIENLLRNMTQGATAAVQNVIPDEIKQALVQGMEKYISTLRQGQGEDGEGFNIMRLVDPSNTRADDLKLASRTAISLDGAAKPLLTEITPAKAKSIKSSFNPSRASDLVPLGRMGYSVKYVPFRVLAGRGAYNPTGASGSFRNPLPSKDLQDELDLIQH